MRDHWIQRALTAFVTFAVAAALSAAEPPVRFDTAGGDDRSAVVLLNFSREAIDLRLPPDPAITNKLLDAMTGAPVVIMDNQIPMQPSSARVLASGDSPCGNVMSAR